MAKIIGGIWLLVMLSTRRESDIFHSTSKTGRCGNPTCKQKRNNVRCREVN